MKINPNIIADISTIISIGLDVKKFIISINLFILKKSIKPTATAKIADTNTAPAAISFAICASLLYDGETRSTTASTAVFIISVAITDDIVSNNNIYCVLEKL